MYNDQRAVKGTEMKIIHLSDLHLGKRLHEFSLLEDQKHILGEIQKIICEEKPDAVVIAGDVYDKSVPPAEAMTMFDDFLVETAGLGTKVFIVGGNHDNSERIAFGGRLMEPSGVFPAPAYSGSVEPVTLEDEYGDVNIYMLPFVKPVNVRAVFPDDADGIVSYTDAVKHAIEAMDVDETARNILVTHQFITGGMTCESEDIMVGGADNVDAEVFDGFDYVALGHLHGPQHIERETIRYCGTPLKYSFSESGQKKTLTVIIIGKKGEIDISERPLAPLRDLREIKGLYNDLMSRQNYINTNTEDYLHVTLTDEDAVPNAINKMRSVFPNIMKLDYENTRTKERGSPLLSGDAESITPGGALSELYKMQNGREMSGQQVKYAAGLIEEIWGERS